MKLCSVEGCGKKSIIRGWCPMHHRRWKIHGDLNFRLRHANGEGGEFRGRMRITLPGDYRVHRAVHVAEKALGKPLPKGALVHHINGKPLDDRNDNLLVCTRGLHNIIHGRMKALAATGNARAKRCSFCHKYESPGVLKKGVTSHFHQACANEYGRNRRRAYENL